MRRPIALAALLLASLCAVSQAAPAPPGACTVPGSHPTIQAAVDDPLCAAIVLAAGTFAETLEIGRSLTLSGPAAGGAVLQGLLRARGNGTRVELRDLRIESGCPQPALGSDLGAELDGSGVEVVTGSALPCPAGIFADGFESGDTSAWSSAVP